MEQPKTEEGKLYEHDWEDHLSHGLKGMRAEMKDRMKDFPTKEFHTHMRAARREMLLAVRSLIDRAIEKTEDRPEEPRAGRITIE